MGEVVAGPQTNIGDAPTVPKLDRLQRREQIADAGGPTAKFQAMWQRNSEATEQAFAALTNQVTDLSAIVRRLEASERLAQAAQATADAASERESLANSYTDPVEVLSATSDGVVTIADHARVYGNGERVSVNGGTVTGFLPGDYVSVAYRDEGREGGVVSYFGSKNPIAQTDPVHVVGQVEIPQAGDPPSSGGGSGAPGYNPPPGGGSGGSGGGQYEQQL